MALARQLARSEFDTSAGAPAEPPPPPKRATAKGKRRAPLMARSGGRNGLAGLRALPEWFPPEVTSEDFDVVGYLARVREKWGGGPWQEFAKKACATDPLLFGILYFPHHLRLREGRGPLTLGDMHLEWCRIALSWLLPKGEPGTGSGLGEIGNRDVMVGPRDAGKTTWWFLIIPMWVAAYKIKKFAAAFAHSGGQSEMHLMTYKLELEDNKWLRTDFPELCSAKRRETTGRSVADTVSMMVSANGFTFAARGVDTANLGMKLGAARPDLIIIDDAEPDESSYSEYQAGKRLVTITDAILPLNSRADVVYVGTTTIAGGIMHQFVKWNKGEREGVAWVGEFKFRVHHTLPIITEEDGRQRSCWAAKWSLEYLISIRMTRTYSKNFLNDPRGKDGVYWNIEDFTYIDHLPGVTRKVLFYDPATTSRRKSDWTGWCYAGYSPSRRAVVVYAAGQFKLTGEKFRARVLRHLAIYDATSVWVESNQGGEHWYGVLHHMPVGVKIGIGWNSAQKEVRAEQALSLYQKRPARVFHWEGNRRGLEDAEAQMISFPDAANDDMVDAVGDAVRRLLKGGGSAGTKARKIVRKYRR